MVNQLVSRKMSQAATQAISGKLSPSDAAEKVAKVASRHDSTIEGLSYQRGELGAIVDGSYVKLVNSNQTTDRNLGHFMTAMGQYVTPKTYKSLDEKVA